MRDELKYRNVVPNEPYVIGSNALDINAQSIYTLILGNYDNILKEIDIGYIPINKSGILSIQKGFLDLVNEETININGTIIKFSNDIWDFKEHYMDGKQNGCYRYLITGKDNSFVISDYYKVILKLFLFYMITENGIHYSSNAMRFNETRRLLRELTKNKITILENLQVEELKQIIESRNINYATICKQKRYIKEFYTFYSLLVKDVYTKEFSDYFDDINTDSINAIIEENKTKLLPTEFYNKYCNLLYNFVFNCKNAKEERAFAGLLYIGTQTGLRGGELTILEENCIKEMKYKDKKVGILKYRSTKNGTKSNIYRNAETNANSKVIDVEKVIRQLFQDERTIKKSTILVINMKSNKDSRNKEYKYSYLETNLHKFNKKLCIKNHKYLGIKNTTEADMFESSFSGEYIKKYFKSLFVDMNLDDVFSVPTIKQFRVYFASELRERGVDDRTISYLLNHDSEEMWGYYVRPKNEIQEDINFSEEIIADVLRDDTKILGPKGDALKKKIDIIIKENNFNIEKDLDAIIDKVCGEVPIRAKYGGFCIKSNPRRECRHDAKTDEFLCAYGCCPNHCHMYFMVSITYNKYLDVKKLVEYNEESGYTNQVQKELYKLESIINQELMPEMIELQNELNRKGKAFILERHIKLENIIDNYTEIKGDIEIWQKKIKEMNL